MDEETIKRLYEAGWSVGDAEDLLADLLKKEIQKEVEENGTQTWKEICDADK